MQAFFSWWGRELSWFIPDVLKERGVSSSRLLWLEFVDAEARFSRIVGGKLVSLGSVALCDTDPGMEKIALDTLFSKIGTKAVGIVVSDEQVLRKELKLPLQARADLEQVIRFEMDRQTPYRAEQVFFHQREVGLEAGQIRANLVILPRHAIDRALARVRQWGLELHAIAVSQQLLGGRDWENLLPTTLRPAVGRFWYWIYGVLGGIAVLLCAALLALPLWQKQELLAKVSDVALKGRA
jgi:general secretion pathway protein L